MPLTPIQRWETLRQGLTAAIREQLSAARRVSGAEMACESFIRELIDGLETRDDGVTISRDRWEAGFRGIAGILVGNRATFEIEDIIEKVRTLAPPPSSNTDTRKR